MARSINRLKEAQVAGARTVGRLGDGGGLFLLVGKGKAKSWAFVSRRGGRWRELGLGSYPSVSLAIARKKATALRDRIENGDDPFEAPAPDRVVPTFGECADEYVRTHEAAFRNAKHRAQWSMTLGDVYCKDIRSTPVDEIMTEDILAVLEPIWTTVPETASRLRGRIEKVLSAAKVAGHRTGENPAIWRGHLELLLPKRQKLSRGHHASMPWAQLPKFWPKLRALTSSSANALAFLILTASRSGEVMGATWGEIEGDVWSIPPERMKAGRLHRVPLTKPALEILETMRARRSSDRSGDYVFPGGKRGSPLSVMALTMVLRGLDCGDVTAHGMRSSFRTWAAEATNHPREIAESALAHVVGSAVERSYQHGDYFEKRRRLMEAWAAFVTPKGVTDG